MTKPGAQSKPAKTEYDRLMDKAIAHLVEVQTLVGGARRIVPSGEICKASARVNDALHAIQGVSRQADFAQVDSGPTVEQIRAINMGRV